MTGEENRLQTNSQGPLKSRALSTLASVRFAVLLVVVIAVACTVGTILPQGADVAKYLRVHPEAEGRMAVLSTLGLTHVYYSWWFVSLLFLLAVSLAACTMLRITEVHRATRRVTQRTIGTVLTHASILLILVGGVIRGVWGERGQINLFEGETVHTFYDGKEVRQLPFAVHLTDFEIELYEADNHAERGEHRDKLIIGWPEAGLQQAFPIEIGVEHVLAPEGASAGEENSFRIEILQYVPDFVMDAASGGVQSRSTEPRNPAILVAVAGPGYINKRWLFAKFPDFNMHPGDGHGSEGGSPLRMVFQAHPLPERRIKDYKSALKIFDGETVVLEQTIEVNDPLSYKGYTLYQSGYDPDKPTWTSLQVVKDPGVPVVYAGFSLLIAGLMFVFYPVHRFGMKRTVT